MLAQQRFPRGPLLADGSFCEVYGTVDLLRDARTRLALKRFRGGDPREGLLPHAFNEAVAAAELPPAAPAVPGGVTARVVAPLHTFVHKGSVHMVLPLAGCDLEAVLSAAAAPQEPAGDAPLRVPLACARDVVAALLRSLRALHDAGLLHHDVKPGNVLLSIDDAADPAAAPPGAAQSVCVVLTDLGLAARRAVQRPVDEGVEASAAAHVAAQEAAAAAPPPPPRVDDSGAGVEEEGDDDWGADPWGDDVRRVGRWQGGMRHQVGTVAWRPPELLFGARRHDCEVDAWSAGVVAAEVLRAALGGAWQQRPQSEPQPPASPAAAAVAAAARFRMFPNGSEIECLCAHADMLGQPDPTVWPALESGNCAELPGFMEMQPTCAHCSVAAGGGGGGGGEAAGRRRQEQLAALATLRSAAAAAGVAGHGLLQLLDTGLCARVGGGGSGGGSGGSGVDAAAVSCSASLQPPPPSPLHHVHGVVQLARWTGMLPWLAGRGGGAGAPPAGGEEGGDAAVALALALFELVLRLMPLDPSRRAPLALALAAEGVLGAEWCGLRGVPPTHSEPPAAALARLVAATVAHRRRAASARKAGA